VINAEPPRSLPRGRLKGRLGQFRKHRRWQAIENEVEIEGAANPDEGVFQGQVDPPIGRFMPNRGRGDVVIQVRLIAGGVVDVLSP